MASNETKIILTAEDRTKAAFDSVAAGLGSLQGVLSRVGFVGFAASIAAFASAGAFVKIAGDTIHMAAALDDMAEKTGASVEALSGLAGVAKISGVAMGDVESTLIRLAKALNGADEESKGAGKAFSALGLDMKKLREKDSAAALQDVAKAFNQFADGSEKTAAALAIFGKQGAQMLPFLKDLAEKGQLQTKITTEQAAQAEALEKSWARLTATGGRLGKSIALDLIPALLKGSEALEKFMTPGAGAEQESFVWIDTFFNKMATRLAQFSADTSDASADFAEFLGLEESAKIHRREGAQARAALAGKLPADAVANAERAYGLDVFGGADTPYKLSKPKLDVTPDGSKKSGEYERITKSLNEYVAELNLAAQSGDKVTRGDKLRLEALRGLTGAQVAAITPLLEWVQAMEDAAEYQKGQAAALMRVHSAAMATVEADQLLEKQMLDSQKAWEDLTDGVAAHALALETEVDRYGQTEAQIQRTIIARLEEAKSLTDPAFEDHLAFLEREINARKRIVQASASRDVMEADAKAAQQAAHDWERISDQIGQSLADAIMDGGKSAGKVLENYFKTLVLRPAITAAMAPVSNAIGGFFGGGSGAYGGQSGGGMSSLSGLGNFMPSGSLYSSIATSSFGQMAGLSEMTSFVANAELGTEAIMAASAEMTSLGSAIGTALPWIGAGLFAANALGLFGDDDNNEQPAGPPNMFWASLSGSASGVDSGSYTYNGRRNDGGYYGAVVPFTDNELAQLGKQVTAIYSAAAQQGTALGLDVSRLGPVAMSYSDIPGFADKSKSSGTAGDAISAALAGLGQKLGDSLLSDPLKSAFGNIGNYAASFDTAYNATHSADEINGRQRRLLEMQVADLGVKLPASLAGFNGLIKGLDITTDAGANTYAQLLKLAPAFAAVTKETENLRNAVLNDTSFASMIDYQRAQRLKADAAGPAAANSVLVAELKALREEYKAGQIAIARYTAETAALLRRWNGDGMPETRDLAA